jgi:hypothetical protein
MVVGSAGGEIEICEIEGRRARGFSMEKGCESLSNIPDAESGPNSLLLSRVVGNQDMHYVCTKIKKPRAKIGESNFLSGYVLGVMGSLGLGFTQLST